MPAPERPMKCLRLCRVIFPRLSWSFARGKCCALERARQAWIGAAEREGERQCDLMNPMMAETAGPSCLKNPCAPCALHGFELGSPVVLIHCTRALPRDHPTKMLAALGRVNWQMSWLWWTTRVGGSLSGDPSVAITLEWMPETN